MERRNSEALENFGGNKLTHLPGLDGLRGLAVAVVVLFHGEWAIASGGFLGVSLFFTLSGFLITSVLLNDLRPQRELIANFWSRRFRRLLPAAWLTIAIVLLTGRWWMDPASIGELRGDGLAALFNIANWRFLWASESYGELFSAPSPLLHYWSLAIEEQLYLLYPVLLVGLSRLLKQRLNALCWALAAACALSWITPLVLGFSDDRIYYGTDTRAGELFAGALLGAIFANAHVRTNLVRRLVPRSSAATLGAVALGGTLLAWIVVDQNSRFLYNGGLAVVSLASVGLIVAAVLPVGPVAALVNLSPLRHLGKISYGVYLFHWPLFVALRQMDLPLPKVGVFLLGSALSVALASLSFHFLEMPIRERRPLAVFAPLGNIRPLQLSAAMVPVMLLGAFSLPGKSDASASLDFDSASSALEDINEAQRSPNPSDEPGARPEAPQGSNDSGSTSGPTDPNTEPDAPSETTPPLVVPPTPTPRVGFFGDSVAVTIANLLASTTDGPPITVAGAEAEQRCGIALEGAYYLEDFPEEFKQSCQWQRDWPNLVTSNKIDVAVVNSALFEILPRLLPGANKAVNLTDDAFYAYVKSEFLAATDALSERGALVVWVNVPKLGATSTSGITASLDSARNPELIELINKLIFEVVAERPNDSMLIDMANFMVPHTDDTSMRPDGLHYNWKIDPQGNAASAYFKSEIVRLFDIRWASFFQ